MRTHTDPARLPFHPLPAYREVGKGPTMRTIEPGLLLLLPAALAAAFMIWVLWKFWTASNRP